MLTGSSLIDVALADLDRSGTFAFTHRIEVRFGTLPAGRGPISRALIALFRRGVRGHTSGRGVVDLAQHRYAVSFGEFAVIGEPGAEWAGVAGLARSRAYKSPATDPTILWFLDVVRAATPVTTVEVSADPRSERLHCVADAADVRRAAGSATVAAPARLELDITLHRGRLGAIDLWLAHQQHRVELTDPGLDLRGFDWTRLPDDAAFAA